MRGLCRVGAAMNLFFYLECKRCKDPYRALPLTGEILSSIELYEPQDALNLWIVGVEIYQGGVQIGLDGVDQVGDDSVGKVVGEFCDGEGGHCGDVRRRGGGKGHCR